MKLNRSAHKRRDVSASRYEDWFVAGLVHQLLKLLELHLGKHGGPLTHIKGKGNQPFLGFITGHTPGCT